MSHLPAEAGERVVAFEINVMAGGIYRLDRLPMGWNIVVNNDPSWRTAVKGSIEVGAAALSADYFHAFMVVRKFEYANLAFELGGRVLVTKDFQHERWIRLSNDDVVTTPSR